MAAPPEVVYAYVNDFHKWAAVVAVGEARPGDEERVLGRAGRRRRDLLWSGNDKVGEGRMTITESRPPAERRHPLEFLKPFPAMNTTEFDIVPDGLGTEVTWSMTGHNNFMAKAFGLFMNMDKMVGGHFERGLASWTR